MPQWDFLDFLADHAKRYAGFALGMRADVDELLFDGDKVVGLRAKTPDGDLEVRADLSSAPTAGIRRCASARGWRSRISERRWTCCGCGCPSGRGMADNSWAAFFPAGCS